MAFCNIIHTSTYNFSKSVFLAPHTVRLLPNGIQKCSILEQRIEVKAKEYTFHKIEDASGNEVIRYTFSGKLDSICFENRIRAELKPVNPFDFYLDAEYTNLPFSYNQYNAKTLAPYLMVQEKEVLESWWLLNGLDEKQTLPFLTGVNFLVNQYFTYQRREEDGVLGVKELIFFRAGSCRDLTWFLVLLLRNKGFAVRFVSGYFLEGEGINHLELHAWAEVYIPGAGWLGLDPTTGLVVDQRYISLAKAAYYHQTLPIEGSTEANQVHSFFSAEVVWEI